MFLICLFFLFLPVSAQLAPIPTNFTYPTIGITTQGGLGNVPFPSILDFATYGFLFLSVFCPFLWIQNFAAKQENQVRYVVDEAPSWTAHMCKHHPLFSVIYLVEEDDQYTTQLRTVGLWINTVIMFIIFNVCKYAMESTQLKSDIYKNSVTMFVTVIMSLLLDQPLRFILQCSSRANGCCGCCQRLVGYPLVIVMTFLWTLVSCVAGLWRWQRYELGITLLEFGQSILWNWIASVAKSTLTFYTCS